MTREASPLSLLSRALDQTGELIDSVRPEQASLPTPCTSWDVRDLVNHVVDELHRFTEMTTEGSRGGPEGDVIGEDWTSAYRDSADALLDAWRGNPALAEGDDKAAWAVHQQLTEVVMHAWDLAKATGRSTDLDPELGQAALDWGRQNLLPEYRGAEEDGGQIGFEVEVPDDAPLYDRLAAFGGRDPR